MVIIKTPLHSQKEHKRVLPTFSATPTPCASTWGRRSLSVTREMGLRSPQPTASEAVPPKKIRGRERCPDKTKIRASFTRCADFLRSSPLRRNLEPLVFEITYAPDGSPDLKAARVGHPIASSPDGQGSPRHQLAAAGSTAFLQPREEKEAE